MRNIFCGKFPHKTKTKQTKERKLRLNIFFEIELQKKIVLWLVYHIPIKRLLSLRGGGKYFCDDNIWKYGRIDRWSVIVEMGLTFFHNTTSTYFKFLRPKQQKKLTDLWCRSDAIWTPYSPMICVQFSVVLLDAKSQFMKLI